MKVLFVHLGREHLGIEYLSAVLKRHGHTVGLALDLGLLSSEDNVLCSPRLRPLMDETDRLVEEARCFQPDVLCFSPYTTTYRWSLQLAGLLRRATGAPTIFGGIHTTLVPDVAIRERDVDFAVVGEGEEALVELLDGLQRANLDERIANVWLKRGGQTIANPPRPLSQDLDSLPLPDKALFEPYVNFHDDYLLMASRGCIFNCSYCCESYARQLYGGRFYRRRSTESVIAELRAMKARYRFREVMFNDAVFFAERDWLREFLERYRREIRVPFRCFGQVKLADEEVMRTLRDAGCYAVEFGLQTINPDVKRRILGRTESVEEALRAFRACDRVKLHYDIDHMFGLPGESPADHRAAALLYCRLRYLNRIKCHNLSYFPRLRIVEEALREGTLVPEEVCEIEHGKVSDFFHTDSIKDEALRREKDAMHALYKILPILPRRWVERLVETGRYRWLRWLPKPLVMVLQVLVAIRGRDYRFVLYFRYYLLRVRKIIQRMAHRRGAQAAEKIR